MRSTNRKLLALASLSVAFAACPAHAATIVFQSNFDTIPVPAGSYVILPTAEGWTATAGDGIEVQNHAAGDPFSETNLVELDSNNNSAMSLFNIVAGSYSLDFLYSPRPGIPATSNGIDVLLNGSIIYNVTGNGGSGTVWSPQHVGFNLSAPGTLTFAATGTSDSLGGYLDNIVLSAVPEPSSWAMMLLGFGAIGLTMRRRRRPGFAQLA